MKQGDIDIVKRIAEIEEHIDSDSLQAKLGWRSRDVGVWPSTLTKLRMEGLIEDVYESNSYHGYRLTQKARALLSGEPSTEKVSDEEQLVLPEDLFEAIIGHYEVKELLRAALLAEKPVHVLLVGPPALAKSLFLWDIERACGDKAIWLVGSATSKAGLWDVVAERQPQVVLIDELDKMNAADHAALLSLMEGGRLVRAKKGRELNLDTPVKVVAAANKIYGLSQELLSRFGRCKIEAYSREEFLAVVRGVLTRYEGIASEIADKIAAKLDSRSQDVRDAVRVARLTSSLGVDRAVELLLPGG